MIRYVIKCVIRCITRGLLGGKDKATCADAFVTESDVTLLPCGIVRSVVPETL